MTGTAYGSGISFMYSLHRFFHRTPSPDIENVSNIKLKKKYDTQRKTENTDSQTHRKQTVKQINLLLYLLHLPVLLWQY